jgi:hypothetical protein
MLIRSSGGALQARSRRLRVATAEAQARAHPNVSVSVSLTEVCDTASRACCHDMETGGASGLEQVLLVFNMGTCARSSRRFRAVVAAPLAVCSCAADPTASIRPSAKRESVNLLLSYTSSLTAGIAKCRCRAASATSIWAASVPGRSARSMPRGSQLPCCECNACCNNVSVRPRNSGPRSPRQTRGLHQCLAAREQTDVKASGVRQRAPHFTITYT